MTNTTIAIVDLLGLDYDGTTLNHKGLGGSESAVIYMAEELSKIGFAVTVFCNNTLNGVSTHNDVMYIDHAEAASHPKGFYGKYDVFISSRSVEPFRAGNIYAELAMGAQYRALWMHDTFCEGDQDLEAMVVQGFIHDIFTLSDFHTNYVLNANHGHRRNFEMLKNHVFQTRNGAKIYPANHNPVIENKDPNLFVYNASATKGLMPLINHVWPRIKKSLPDARLVVIGGYYNMRDGSADAQQQTVEALRQERNIRDMDVSFTGVIRQREVAELFARAYMTLYPTDFPETFGISTLESLIANTPVATCRFGALEETAVDLACYKLDYTTTPNFMNPGIDQVTQCERFADMVIAAVTNPRLHKQKQQYCNALKTIAGWDTIAKQWKQHIYHRMGKHLPVKDYHDVMQINSEVQRVFGRTFSRPEHAAPWVSVLTPTKFVIVSPFFNARPYLQDHIDSVASQYYSNFTHVMIDDASTDGSGNFVQHHVRGTMMRNGMFGYNAQLITRDVNLGALANQTDVMNRWVDEDVVFMLLDGDDQFMPDNRILQFYDDVFHTSTDMTYGSMWSVADNMPLIGQKLMQSIPVRDQRYRFEWQIPYTHLRTFRSSVYNCVDHTVLKDSYGNYLKAGADNPFFYQLIENAEFPRQIERIVVKYNDLNPLCDFRVNAEEQTRNASSSYV